MRISLIVAPVLLAAGGGALAWRLLGPVDVAAGRVLRGTAVEAVYASGSVEARDRVDVKARVGGPVGALYVREGDAVHKDQTLLRVDAPTLGFDVNRGRAELHAAQERFSRAPQLASLEAQAQSLRAQLQQARSDVSRIQRLVSSGATARLDLERAQTQVATLEAQVAANQATQQDVRIGLRAAAQQQRAGVAALQARANDAELRSPLDGVVLQRRIEVGEVVAVNQNLLRIGDLGHLWIEAQIDEADIGRVREGLRAAVRLYAFEGRVVQGRVARVLPDADRERKSFEVDLELTEPVEGLRPGMTAEVNVILKERAGVLLVPREALRDGHVWVIGAGRLERREVQAGIRDLGRVEVLAGLREGELVALDDEDKLRPGLRVRPLEPAPRGANPAQPSSKTAEAPASQARAP